MHSPIDDLLFQDNPPTLSGMLQEPAELRALLSLLRSCAMDGWLRVATLTWSSDIFFQQGRVVAARRAANWGAAALAEILAESSAKWFSLSTWPLLDGVTLAVREDVLEHVESWVPPAQGPRAPGPAPTAASLDGAVLQEDQLPLVAAPGEPARDAGQAPAPPEPQLRAEVLGLVDQVRVQVRLPVDALEVTAVLESLGITDEVALQRYGAPDVFVLAEDVHRTLGPLLAASCS